MLPIAGYLTDLAGRVKLIALANYLSAAILLLYVFAPRWEMVAVAGLLQGFLVFQFPPSSAIIADSLSPRSRGVGTATMRTIAGVVAMFSPYLAGAVLDACGVKVGMRYLYGVMAAVAFISATIHLRFLKETSTRSEEKLSLSRLPTVFGTAYGGIPSLLRRLPRPLQALAAVVTLGFMANGVASPFWVVYAVERIGLSSVQWGLILLIENAVRNLVFIPAGLLADRYGKTKSMLVSLLLSLVSIPLFVFAASFTQVLLIRLVVAVANAFFTPACSALMADIVPRDSRGRVMAAIGRGTVMLGPASGGTGGPGLGFVTTVPLMIASLLGGYLYTLNAAYPWFFVSIATVISVVLLALFIRDPEEAQI
jgi:MFS family permease